MIYRFERVLDAKADRFPQPITIQLIIWLILNFSINDISINYRFEVWCAHIVAVMLWFEEQDALRVIT